VPVFIKELASFRTGKKVYYNGKQNTASSSYLKKLFDIKHFSNLILFTYFAKLPTDYVKLLKDVNKHPSSKSFLNPELSLSPRKLYLSTKFTLTSDTNEATRSKTKTELAFSLATMEFCNSICFVRYQPSRIDSQSALVRQTANQRIFGWKKPLLFH